MHELKGKWNCPRCDEFLSIFILRLPDYVFFKTATYTENEQFEVWLTGIYHKGQRVFQINYLNWKPTVRWRVLVRQVR
jgi:hypothetical protein